MAKSTPTKSVQSLSGAAKDAYLRQILATEPDLGPTARERVAERLHAEITRVWVRTSAPALAGQLAEPSEAGSDADTASAETAFGAFDPFTPNVIVVLRTGGHEKVLAALSRITTVENLQMLAREQQLGIDPELAAADEIRSAIVTAAERRIANRRAAAS